MVKKRVFLLLTILSGLLVGAAWGSQCVDCHTNVEKLKEVAKTIPKPVASVETAGKG